MASRSLSDTCGLVSDSLSIVYNTKSDMDSSIDSQQILTMLSKIDERLEKIEKFESRLTKIEKYMERLDLLEQRMDKFSSAFANLESHIGKTNKTVADLECDVSGMGNIFDEVKSQTIENTKACKDLGMSVGNMENNLSQDMQDIYEDNSYVREEILDLKCRSMRDNLLFHGLPEENDENCELIVQNFIHNVMKIEKEIVFERVHRIGRRPTYSAAVNDGTSLTGNRKPRTIVARFSHFKDRERVRFAAPKTLKGTEYSVYEQFPVEIEERRKLLYPKMRSARKNGNKVRLVKDRLYINSEQYIPPHSNDDPSSSYTTKLDYDPRFDHPSPSSQQTRKRARVNSNPR